MIRVKQLNLSKRVFACLVLLVCLFFWENAAKSDTGTWIELSNEYHRIRTDLGELEAREAGLRMESLTREFRAIWPMLAEKPGEKLPVILHRNVADYVRAGGMEGTAGVVEGKTLTAVTLRQKDGLISQASWHVLQHEGFHQFARAGKLPAMPMWLDEGMAEYVGEAIFAGDGWVMGLVPQGRLNRLRQLIKQGKTISFAKMMQMDRGRWNEKIDMAKYDQAWGMVHFYMHADDKTRKVFFTALERFGRDGALGMEVGLAEMGSPVEMEKRWEEYWSGLADYPSSDDYARATVCILASFVGRLELAGQGVGDFESLMKRDATTIRLAKEQWLPGSLLQMGQNQASKMRLAGDVFIVDAKHMKVNVVTATKSRISATAIVKNGKVMGVKSMIEDRATGRKPATLPATNPQTELVK